MRGADVCKLRRRWHDYCRSQLGCSTGGKNIAEGFMGIRGVVLKHSYLTRLVKSDVLPSRVRALAVRYLEAGGRHEHHNRGIRVHSTK